MRSPVSDKSALYVVGGAGLKKPTMKDALPAGTLVHLKDIPGGGVLNIA